MMILRKKRDGHQPQTRMEKRVSKISTPDLILWMEHSMYTIGKSLTSWQKTNDKTQLDDVLLGAEAFYTIAKELKRREV